MQRLQLICAVIEKRLKLSLWNRDVYLNVVGGLRVSEPASDLAVAVTITSSLVGMKIKAGICFIGEIGLSGEIRRIKGLEIRIAEAVKMGFTTIIIPDLGPKNPFKKKKFSSSSRRNEIKLGSNDSSDEFSIEYDNNNNNSNNSDNDSHYDDDKINQIDINLETKIKRNKTNNKQNKISEQEHEVISCSTLIQALTIALEVESFNDILDKLKNSSKKKRKISDSTNNNNNNNNNQEKTNWSSSRGFDSNSVETENNFYSDNNNDDEAESENFTMNEDDVDDVVDDDDNMNGNYYIE